MDEWRKATLGDLCDGRIIELQTGPFGSQLHAHDYTPVGVAVVPTEAIRNRQIDHSVLPRISETKAAELARHRLKSGDILFARRGVQATGHIGCIREAEEGFVCGTGAIRLRVIENSETVDRNFLSHVLANPTSVEWFKFHAIGATMPNLNEGIIRSFPISLPPLKDQRTIAHILGTLDDKIELNRRMNETLEAMARALFKSWFVDFDPVQRKATGREIDFPKQIVDLFPNSFEDSESRKIPKGWRVAPIGELARIVGGSTPSTERPAFWTGGRHYWATPKDLSRLSTSVLLETERKITDEGLSQIGSGLLPPGALLLSSRAPIGYLAISEIPVAINQGFIGMLSAEGVPNLFLLYWSEWAHDEIVSRANGSTFLEISKASFRPIPIVRPPDVILDMFEKTVRPAYARIVSNEQEVRTLAALRDALLPKLISGEIRVKDAEPLAREVA